MPKKIEPLTPVELNRKIEKLKQAGTQGLIAAGGVPGLHLQVTAAGATTWILRFTAGVKPGTDKPWRRDLGLGSYDKVSLKDAREKAKQAHALIADGIDPITEKREARSAMIAARLAEITFEEAAKQFIAAQSVTWKEGGKSEHQWTTSLEDYAYPVIGSLRVADIELTQVLKVVEPIWTTKTETARRVRSRMEQVLDWATVRGYRKGDNPARWRGALDKVLPAPDKVRKVKHHAALSIAELPDFLTRLRQRNGIGARALEFAVLTAARSGEVRGAVWDEIDLEARVWTIPADRMKASKEHRVPLSDKTHNIYFSINPTRKPLNKKAEKTDIARLEWLHVDIDPAAGEDFEQERERIKAMLTTKRPQGIPEPSIIIDSGNGFWGMWRLSEPLDIPPPASETDKPWEKAEAYNRHLETVFRADHCFNIDRIARLPGLTNWPDANKRKKGRVPRDAEVYSRSDAVYPLTAFKAAPPITGGTPTASRKASPRAAVGDGTAPDENWIPGTASPFGTDELKTWAVERGKWHGDEEKPTPPGKIGQRLLAVMAQGADPLDAARYPSRSEAQFYVSCELVRAGVPDELHYRILTTPGSGVADSVLDQKSDVHGYALRQIRKAHEEAEREWWRSPDAAMNYLNNKHAVIADIGGKCRIITEVRDPALKRTKISKQSFEDFRNRYRHIKVLVESPDDGKPVFKAAGTFWIDDPKRRQYETITFAPGREVEEAYNLWRGFAVESRPGDKHESFLAHVRDNVCAGNPDHFAYLLGWMARAVQEPDSPGEVAVVIRGGRGTGKSFFAKMFGRLFGRHYLQVSDSKHLTGSFNAHLRDTVLLFGDEAFYAGDKKHESILKTLVTEEHLVIEGKGVDAEAGSNYVHLILASNEDWVVPAGLDERRFFALEVGEGHKQDHAYFKAITGDLYNGGLEHLLHFLLTYDLSAFEVRQVPKTQALRGQQIESLKGFEKYLYEQLWEAALPKCGKQDGPRWFVFSTPLVEVAVEWLNQRREPPKVSTSKVQRVLDRRLGVEKGRLDNLNGYYWDVAQMRAAWDQEMFPVDWPPLPEKPPF